MNVDREEYNTVCITKRQFFKEDISLKKIIITTRQQTSLYSTIRKKKGKRINNS